MQKNTHRRVKFHYLPTVGLQFDLFVFSSFTTNKQPNIFLFGRIQSSQIRDQLHVDSSPYGECVTHYNRHFLSLMQRTFTLRGSTDVITACTKFQFSSFTKYK